MSAASPVSGPDGAVPVLPSAELHVHIEGTLEPELAFALAARNGMRLRYTDLDELRRAYAFSDLQSFLRLYYELTAVLRRPEDFADLADAYFARAAAQGVRHAEVFVDPQAHTSRGVPLEVVMEGLGEAFGRAPERHGLSARLIACFLRDRDPAEAEELLPRLLPYRDLVIGVGLDSAEVGHPPELFERVFARAADEGLHRVAHGGEEGPPAYVRSALDRLGVERVDHGNRSLEDPSLVARLREEQVPLTVCPLSNLALRGIDRIEAHPLRRMHDGRSRPPQCMLRLRRRDSRRCTRGSRERALRRRRALPNWRGR
jgi:adenosine deaminase